MKQPDLLKSADPLRLHRIHAAPAARRGGVSFELRPFRWRPDGGGRGDHHLARAIAYRIAFTCNNAEGIPLQSLEAGYLREFHTAVLELAEAILSSTPLGPLIDQARRLLGLEKAIDFDRTNGRLSDCPHCEQLEDDVAAGDVPTTRENP